MSEVDPAVLAARIDKMHDAYEAKEGPQPPSLWCPLCGRRHRAAARQDPDGRGPIIVWVCYQDNQAYEALADALHAKKLLIYPVPVDIQIRLPGEEKP